MSRAVQRWGNAVGWVVMVVAPIVIVLGGSRTLLNLAMLIGIWTLWGISQNIVWGYAGQFSMVQVGLGGLAAYLTAVLHGTAGWSIWAAALCGIVAAVLVSLVIAVASMKQAGFQFGIMTQAFALAFVGIINVTELVGGPSGIPSLVDFGKIQIGGFTWGLSALDGGGLIFLLVIVVLAMLLVGRLLHSRTGRGLLAIREDPLLASSLGVRPSTYRLVAFSVSAVIAGIAGIMYAEYLRFLNPTFFDLNPLITLIVITVLGGRGYKFGPFVGAAVYFTLSIQFGLSDLVFGIVLVVIVLIAPGGILGTAERLWRARGRLRARLATLGTGKAVTHD